MNAANDHERFPASLRLRKKREYDAVFSSATKFSCREFTLLARPAESARLGLVVSRKVGNATQRNRTKRVLREAFRRTRSQLRAADLVVIARADLLHLTTSDIEARLLRFLKAGDAS